MSTCDQDHDRLAPNSESLDRVLMDSYLLNEAVPPLSLTLQRIGVDFNIRSSMCRPVFPPTIDERGCQQNAFTADVITKYQSGQFIVLLTIVIHGTQWPLLTNTTFQLTDYTHSSGLEIAQFKA